MKFSSRDLFLVTVIVALAVMLHHHCSADDGTKTVKFLFPHQENFAEQTKRLKITPEAAKALVVKQQTADGNPVRHELRFLYGDWYVHLTLFQKTGLHLHGYYVNSRTGDVKRLRDNDEIKEFYGGKYGTGYMSQYELERLRAIPPK